MERTSRPQAAFLAASAMTLAVLLAGCGTATPSTGSTSRSPSVSTHPTATGHATGRASAAYRRHRKPVDAPSTGAAGTTTLGFVVRRTRLAHGYRVVIAPARHRMSDGSFVVIPGRAPVTYVVPRSFVPDADVLVGAVEITAEGRRVTAVVIVGG